MTQSSEAISVNDLNEQFAGRRVRIIQIDGNSTHVRAVKVCQKLHARDSGVDIELVDGSRYGFFPDTNNVSSAEGPMGYGLSGRRRIELVHPSIKSAIEELQQASSNLHALFVDDPHRGAWTWQESLVQAGQDLYDLLKAKVPKP